MKKTIIYVLVLMFGFMTTYGQHTKDTLKKSMTDSVSIYSKLKADQIFELEKDRINIARHSVERPPWQSALVLFVPIAGISMVILITFIIFYFVYKTRRSKYGVFIKYAELGKEIPSEFFYRAGKRISKLSNGIILISSGFGLIIALLLLVPVKVWAIGIIPIFIGIGYLLIYFIEKKSKQNNESTR